MTPTEAAAATTAAATESVSEETAATEENVNENGDRVLTLEEQRDVAFKVIFFFMMLILASFAILYIYHRTSQKNRKDNSTQQKTFCEFLAGQMDDTYPTQAGVTGRYGF